MTNIKLLVLCGLTALCAVVHCDYDSKVWPKLPHWLKCGMPRCSEKWPEEVQAELKKIWANYVEGEECTAEREAQKKYIESLPEDIKAIIRPKWGRRWCRPPRFIKKLSVELQQKIEAVWAGYKEGEECHEQKKATREILSTITEEEWKELRPRGGRRGGRGPFPGPFPGGPFPGGPFPPYPPPPPPPPVAETTTFSAQ